MIASLSGLVLSANLNSAVIEVGGVGISVQLPARFAAGLAVGTRATLFTSLVVREDSLTLFGFESPEARDFFELLQTVSGIGPKVAQSALSIYEPHEIVEAIRLGNSSALERIPGLGKKGVARTILELKEKVSQMQVGSSLKANSAGWRDQVINALLSLGYTGRDAEVIVEELQVSQGSKLSELSISQILKLALQSQGRK